MIVALWASLAVAQTATDVPTSDVPRRLWDTLTTQAPQGVAARMSTASAALLGTPYGVDPAGEGQWPDFDPEARYDVFDCLTFVEEVLAFSLATSFDDVSRIRRAFRYGTHPPSYRNRRHFMELQWLPGAIEAGWLVDSTGRYGETTRLTKNVTAFTWKHWPTRQRFALTDEELPVGPMQLDVLPLPDAQQQAGAFAPGSLLLTVRTDLAGVPIWITHVSLVVQDESGATVLRHATKIGGKDEVKDHNVAWYLKHLETYTNWPVAGVAVLEPRKPSPRVP